MSERCCCGSVSETLVLTCAGAAYSGQVAHRVGVNLMHDGNAALFCVTAVAAEVPDNLERARNAAQRVVIDGCEDHCARKIIEKAGLPVDLHLDVSAIGIPRKADKPEMINDAKRVVEAVRTRIGCCG